MKKRRVSKKQRVTWEQVIKVCAWCGKQIPEGAEVFSLGGIVRPGVVLHPEGNVIQLALRSGRTVYAIVPADDSEARQQGLDLLFVLCSPACGRELKEVLRQDIDLIDRLSTA